MPRGGGAHIRPSPRAERSVRCRERRSQATCARDRATRRLNLCPRSSLAVGVRAAHGARPRRSARAGWFGEPGRPWRRARRRADAEARLLRARLSRRSSSSAAKGPPVGQQRPPAAAGRVAGRCSLLGAPYLGAVDPVASVWGVHGLLSGPALNAQTQEAATAAAPWTGAAAGTSGGEGHASAGPAADAASR